MCSATFTLHPAGPQTKVWNALQNLDPITICAPSRGCCVTCCLPACLPAWLHRLYLLVLLSWLQVVLEPCGVARWWLLASCTDWPWFMFFILFTLSRCVCICHIFFFLSILFGYCLLTFLSVYVSIYLLIYVSVLLDGILLPLNPVQCKYLFIQCPSFLSSNVSSS